MNTQPHYMNDNTLVQLLRSDEPDDNKALLYIIEHKQENVTSKLRVPVHIKEDAMFHHALYELWRYVRKSDFDTSKKDAIERFLYIVCQRYIWKNSGKGNSNMDELPELADYILFSMTEKERSLLLEIFDRLGSGCKDILKLKFFENMPHKEIAEKINSTEGSTRVKYSQCLKKLKKWIAEDNDLAQYIRNLLTE